MKEHNGNEARNARINISYTGKKPQVNFSYPVKKKDSKTRGDLMFVVFSVWILINLPFLFYLTYSNSDFLSSNLGYNDSSDYNISNYSEFVEYYTQPTRIDYFYDANNNPTKILYSELLNLKTLFMLLYFFGIPSLIYFPFKKKWDSKFPDYQAYLAKKRYVKFTQKDIKKDDDSIYIELPIFNNVICDFKATKDFSKYLKEFEIREHNFKYHELPKKKSRKIQNETLWYTKWYFDKEPKDGFLEVIFK